MFVTDVKTGHPENAAKYAYSKKSIGISLRCGISNSFIYFNLFGWYENI